MIREELKDKIFVGVVEENNDPDRIGRVKARVIKVYDGVTKENIPWASPFKDLNGNEYNVPDIGKIVSVVFQDGDDKLPEYIYAEHYNINLENKLKALSADDYASFKSIFLDHSTQIYRNNSEGLKIDHEYTNINLDQYGNIALNLRDPSSIITLGSNDADENALLATTWMNWFDTFVENLLGSNGGPYLGNLGAPVTPNPSFIDCLQQYQDLRENFLSKHVKISKNSNIASQKRPYVKQFGDNYTTNVGEVLTTTQAAPYTPTSDYTSTTGSENPANLITKDNLGSESPSIVSSKKVDIDPKTVSILWNCNLFNQGDPTWANYGDGTYTIRQAGCALSTFAMYASAFGKNASPLDFFNANGRKIIVSWNQIQSKYGFPLPTPNYNCNQNKLDFLLGNAPILWESKNHGGNPQYVHGHQHWMLIVGKNLDGTYIVHDPNGGKQRLNVPANDILNQCGRLSGLNSRSNALFIKHT